MSNKSTNIIGVIIFLSFGFIFFSNLPSAHHKEMSEAEQNIALTNKTQFVFVLENGRFATTFDELELGVLTGGSTAATTNLEYKLDIRSKDLAIIGTKPIAGVPYPVENREGYAFNGATLRFKNGKGSTDAVTIVCRSQTSGADGTDSAQAPIVAAGELRCADGWDKISF